MFLSPSADTDRRNENYRVYWTRSNSWNRRNEKGARVLSIKRQNKKNSNEKYLKLKEKHWE